MSNFNYMDNVPVKISESYKPPPRVYQLPQAIQHRLSLPADHYQQSSQYSYECQLERKVMAKIPEWRRMRQQERETRRERKEKREQQRLRDMEAQHRQLLGAVSYPSAEELSSTDSDDEEDTARAVGSAGNTEIQAEKTVVSTQANSFHNILQPTILPRHSGGCIDIRATDTNITNHTLAYAGSASSGVMENHSNAFNYKDFENDTSSPFDNIELKTINDLDILAQVLHNTQLKAEEQRRAEMLEQQVAKDNLKNNKMEAESVEQSNAIAKDESGQATELAVVEKTKAELEKVDFNGLSQQLQKENIPNSLTSPAIVSPLSSPPQPPQHMSNNYAYHVQATYASYMPPAAQQPACMPYQLFNGLEQQQVRYTNVNSNQNYLYASNNCNGIGVVSNSYFSATHAGSFIGHNANNYLQQANEPAPAVIKSPLQTQMVEAVELNLKSKSVPDILKELRDEVRNSEMRRSRNCSHNIDDKNAQAAAADDEKTPHASPTKIVLKYSDSTHYFTKLEAPAQKLAKNISSMGFPLERVSKISQMFGTDDKKIIEHLIPLSELIDLGFDETKISEALMKFDNNKEKALEYLIS